MQINQRKAGVPILNQVRQTSEQGKLPDTEGDKWSSQEDSDP